MKHLPKKFSPRKDVVYLFEEETKVDAMKRKLYERKPFETRFTAKLQNYAKDINDNLKIQDSYQKYIEAKFDISNALFESSKISRANYSKSSVQTSGDVTPKNELNLEVLQKRQ